MRILIRYGKIISLVVLVYSCDYYLGFNQQPEFKNDDIEAGLNIFGMLRPDSVGGFNKSFVFVNQILPVMDLESFNIIRDAEIRVERNINNEFIELVEFPLVYSDSIFADTLYRPLTPFSPQPGERFRLICRLEGLPDAVGEATFPSKPVIAENSLNIHNRTLSFSLAPDSLIGMIDIYHVIDNNYVPLSRIVPNANDETHIELNLPVDPAGTRLIIYAYDQNMAVYNHNANISLNFNKFRTTFSTLESGFGVFGAMNFLEINLAECFKKRLFPKLMN